MMNIFLNVNQCVIIIAKKTKTQTDTQTQNTHTHIYIYIYDIREVGENKLCKKIENRNKM